ncbi:MAG: hypothetical protein WC121_13925 [Candidatus Kapaibacterium sp.]|jgi:hypothetical protein
MLQAKKVLASYDKIVIKNPKFGNNTFAQGAIKFNGSPLKLQLKGDLFMLPSRQESEEYGLKYSLGVEFNESDCAVFDKLLDTMADMKNDNEYDRKEAHNDGKIFLSLKPNAKNNDFKCAINLPIKPLKLVNDKIDVGEEVEVDMLVSGWWMAGENGCKYGLTLGVKAIRFANGDDTQPPAKKKKIDVEN